jgi:hypothetical protein
MLSQTLKTQPDPGWVSPYALTASSVKLVQTNVFICNYSHYIAGSFILDIPTEL